MANYLLTLTKNIQIVIVMKPLKALPLNDAKLLILPTYFRLL